MRAALDTVVHRLPNRIQSLANFLFTMNRQFVPMNHISHAEVVVLTNGQQFIATSERMWHVHFIERCRCIFFVVCDHKATANRIVLTLEL